MEPTTSEFQNSIRTRKASTSNATNAITDFVRSVTPRAGSTPRNQFDLFDASANPSRSLSANPGAGVPAELTIQDHRPSAEPLNNSENLGIQIEQSRTSHLQSIRRASLSIQALRAFSQKKGSSGQASSALEVTASREASAASALTIESPNAASSRQNTNLTILEFAEPVALAAAAAYAGSCLATSTAPQKRFIDPITAGTALGAASSVGSFLTSGAIPIIAGAYALHRANQFIHTGCRNDQEKLTADFTKRLEEHRAATDSRLDAFANQVGNVLKDVGSAIVDTGTSLDQVTNIVQKIAPEGNTEVFEAIHNQARRLCALGKETEHSPRLPAPKEKTCSCCCVQ